MRKVVVNESNKMAVFGQLKKFFKHRDFIGWHNFDVHGKTRFSPILNLTDPFSNKPEIFDSRVVYRGVETTIRDGKLVVTFSSNSGIIVDEGYEVYFLGNRVVIKYKWYDCDHNNNYCYLMFQILSDNDNIEGIEVEDNCGYSDFDYLCDEDDDYGY